MSLNIDSKLNIIGAALAIDNILNTEDSVKGYLCASCNVNELESGNNYAIAIIPGNHSQYERLFTKLSDAFGFKFNDTHKGECSWDNGVYLNKQPLSLEITKTHFWGNNDSYDLNKRNPVIDFESLTFDDFQRILNFIRYHYNLSMNWSLDGDFVIIESNNLFVKEIFDKLFGNIDGKKLDGRKIKLNICKEVKQMQAKSKKKINATTLINKYLTETNKKNDLLNSLLVCNQIHNDDSITFTLYIRNLEDFNNFLQKEGFNKLDEEENLLINNNVIQVIEYSETGICIQDLYEEDWLDEYKNVKGDFFYTGLGNKKPISFEKFKKDFMYEEEISTEDFDAVISSYFMSKNKTGYGMADKMSFGLANADSYLLCCTENQYDELQKLFTEKYGEPMTELISEDFSCQFIIKRIDPCSLEELFSEKYDLIKSFFDSDCEEPSIDVIGVPNSQYLGEVDISDLREIYESNLVDSNPNSNKEIKQYFIDLVKLIEKSTGEASSIDYIAYDDSFENVKIKFTNGNSLEEFFSYYDTDNHDHTYNKNGKVSKVDFLGRVKITKTNLSLDSFIADRSINKKNKKYSNYMRPLVGFVETKLPPTDDTDIPQDQILKDLILTEPTLIDKLKDEAKDASYKVAANKFTDIFKALIINMVAKKSDSDKVREVCKFFDTEHGAGLLQYGIGQFIEHSGLFDELSQKNRLASEFRTGGIARIEETMIDYIMPGLNNIMNKFSTEPKKSIRVSIPQIESKAELIDEELGLNQEELELKSKC